MNPDDLITMSQAASSPMTKPEAYEAYREGELSESEAREFFGREWNAVKQMETVEEILAAQPDPETDPNDLFL